jgi:gas vesicle protein
MRNDGFLTGMLAGVALGALVAVAMNPQTRRPMMEGMGEFRSRMRKMMRRGGRMVEFMMPDEA